ncbi:alpha/beta hydrolase [Mycobacterium sp. ITM-2016-00318]|uniref:alpha/beta hydrolase n=1 Tax=Mycobacterium sp. ITM-2016-00318 TaxID=2099693 RepID=UPI000CF91605|nr:alpha/beta hydrolase [Mycobacterium sp. ITM-2016-00318]WNG95246.1 alpha/beta hydrolase [Mycobacterium sp. ITM-2016-00318]
MRTIVALAATGVAALAIRRCVALRKSISAAAPELRTPLLAASSIPFNRLTLPIVRFAMGRKSDPGPGITLSDHHLKDPDLDVLVLTPSEKPVLAPGVLWIHGGGFVAGTARFEAPWAGRLVTALGAIVVCPEYRLAPENPFPAGLDDCVAALQWMVKHADELGIDVERIAVCGASAGGGLAAAVVQRAFDEGIPLRAQGLVYPMIDDRTALRDDLTGKGELTWSASSNRWAWTAYLGRELRSSDAPDYAAAARRTDLSGLPPAWIGVGELDVFHDEDVAYAERLKAAGVPCELVTVPGMYHGADGLVQKASSMQSFQAGMLDFLRTHLG